MSRPRSLLPACMVVMLFVLAVPGISVSCSDSAFSCGDTLSINGTVFKDIRGLGVRTPDAPGLPGVKIRLWQKGSMVCTTTSDESGGYIFNDLDPGTYDVDSVVPSGWTQTLPGCGSHRITLTDKSAHRFDIGEAPPKPTIAAGELAYRPIMTAMHFSVEELLAMEEEYKKMPQVFISPQTKALVEASPRGSFSLLNYLRYCPRERTQGRCGNCWVWGSTAPIEIDLAVNKGIRDRLSIEYIVAYRPKNACCGGTLYELAYWYRVLGMLVPWSNANAQWQDGYSNCSSKILVLFNTISSSPSYPISSMKPERIPTWYMGQEEAINNIKSVLKQNRAVSFGFDLPTTSDWNKFRDFWSKESESDVFKLDFACGKSWNDSEGLGHLVACVGYNDTDPNNRYWVMLNSWGAPSSRPGGLFRVSMDMNYSCTYTFKDYNLHAFEWLALNITYPNYPPAIPDRPSGPSCGSTGEGYSFLASASDPEGNMVRYLFDWGDGTTSITHAVRSGKTAIASHAWERSGDYCIRVSAVDDQGASSAQSGPSRITVRSHTYAGRTPAVNRNNIMVGELKTFGFGGGQATNNIYVGSDQKR